MRFELIKKYKVDDLLLDEGNYRFIAAKDQKGCIEKIYASNPTNFKNLMKSIVEDDLGELLLVYEKKGKNIVLDGNRRLACLKVLSDITLAPNETVAKYAQEFLKESKINLKNIHAQVSNDKSLIYKTVYERHAAGQGKSRIDWSAYGAARFRYDNQMDDGNEWQSIALLLETEKKFPEWSYYIDSKMYSHEVFRRIIKAAIEQGKISSVIFSKQGQRIKLSADKKNLDDAIEKTVRILQSMENKDLSLSRSGNYADKKGIDLYLEDFDLSPDNQRLKSTQVSEPANDPNPTSEADNNKDEPGKSKPDSSSSDDTTKDQSDNPKPSPNSSIRNGVGESEGIKHKLNLLKFDKLISLYNSLCTVSVNAHPQLLYVGAWSFFETLTCEMGRVDTTSFPSYLSSHMNNMGYDKALKKSCAASLNDISDKGNATKHSSAYYPKNAGQLIVDFKVLEPLILSILDNLITKKNNKAA